MARHNIRDSKGRFIKVPKGIALKKGDARLVGIWDITDIVNESITVTCKECGKLFSTLKRKIEEKGGLCTMCFLNQSPPA